MFRPEQGIMFLAGLGRKMLAGLVLITLRAGARLAMELILKATARFLVMLGRKMLAGLVLMNRI